MHHALCVVAVLLLVCLLTPACVLAAQPKPPAQPQLLRVPSGFTINVFSADVPTARAIASAEVNGSTIVYVGSTKAGNVYYLVGSNSSGTPDLSGKLLSGIDTPNGVAVQGSSLYVSGFEDGKGMIWRLDDVHEYALQNKPYSGTKTVITDQLPGESNHGRRFLRFSPKGLLVVSIGVPCNVCKLNTTAEGIQFGSLYSLNVTSGDLQQIATGIRNSVGFDWHPATEVLYFTDNGRDKIGDDSPDCELNRLPGPALAVADSSQQLPDFGFPFCQTQGLGDPYQRDLGGGEPLPDPDLNPDNSVVNCSAPGAYQQPVQAMGPHTAPLGMRFYRWRNSSAAFPVSYNNSIFVVQRGSWNRAAKIGYRVMLLQLDGAGQPTAFRQFASGWLQREKTPAQYSWGRPVDVEQLPDGSLLVSDDDQGMLYRIAPSTAGSEALQADPAAGAVAPAPPGVSGESMPVAGIGQRAAQTSAAEQSLASRGLVMLATALGAAYACLVH